MRQQAITVALLFSLVAVRAEAQATPQARAAAEALFRDGVALAKDGNLKEACPKFEESQRLDPQTGTLVYLATCHAEQGKTATAWIEFNRAATLAARAGQTERAEMAKLRASELEPRLSRLTIEAEHPVDGMKITLDGSELELPSLGTPLPVDPGEHELSVSAPGHEGWTQRITVSNEPGVQPILIPALVATPASSSPETKPAPVPGARDSRPRPRETSGGTQRTFGWISVGVGALGVGVGSYFGLRAMGTKSDADEYCQGRYCEPPGLSKHDDAKQQATISTVAFGVGLAATGVGVALILSSSSSKQSSALMLGTRATHGGGELSLGRTW